MSAWTANLPACLRRCCWVVGLVGIIVSSCASGSEVDNDEFAAMMAQERQAIIDSLPETTETQRSILADGYVAPSEIDRAATEVVECGIDQGVDIQLVFQEGSGRPSFNTSSHTTDQEIANRRFAIADVCMETFFGLVNRALALQDALSSEETDRLNALVLDCLAAAGFDVGSWPDVQSEPDPSVEADCVDSAMNKLGNS